MVKIDQNALVKALPEIAKSGGAELPAWLNKTGEIVDGINKMLEAYFTISGQGKPAQQTATMESLTHAPVSFHEAREIKKAEVAARTAKYTPPEGGKMNEFKELLEGFIKTVRTLQNMGFGEKRIGEVLLEMPFTVDQAEAFLAKLYASKYG